MSLVKLFGAIALDAGAVTLLGGTTWVAFQSRERPSAPPFIVLLGALTLWAVFSLGSELAAVVSRDFLSLVWDMGQLGAALLVPGAWTVYVLGYTGRGTGLTWRRIALLAGIALPVVGALCVILVRPPESVAESLLVSLLAAELVYLFVLIVYTTYLLVDVNRHQSRVSTGMVALLFFGVGAPYFVGASANGATVADGVTVGLLVSGGLLAVGLRRYPLLITFPKADYVARTRVVEGLQEAVIVLDWENHILDANTTAAAVFDVPTPAMIGDPLTSVSSRLGDCDLSAGAAGIVTLQTTRGRRQFQFSVSAVDSSETSGEDQTDPVARTVLLRDVTDRQTREQRLTVLNRVLRHNVRNKLDVVLAHAELVEDEELQTGIRDSVTELLALSDKARRAEEIMTASMESPESVDLTAVATGAVDECQSEHPESEIELSCPEELRLSTHRSVVRAVLGELLENALTHSDSPSPSIDVRIQEGTDAAAKLTVADDGPGIPEHDRQILNQGAETQLQHVQGIGLWFVNWAVTQLGGDLSFAETEPDGTARIVTLYGSTVPS